MRLWWKTGRSPINTIKKRNKAVSCQAWVENAKLISFTRHVALCGVVLTDRTEHTASIHTCGIICIQKLLKHSMHLISSQLGAPKAQHFKTLAAVNISASGWGHWWVTVATLPYWNGPTDAAHICAAASQIYLFRAEREYEKWQSDGAQRN